MKVGYARVSTKGQNLERQIEILKKFGAEKIFQEKASGAEKIERKAFKEMLEFIREGDVLIVESIDRLGRHYESILGAINELKHKNVSLIITSLPMTAELVGNELFEKFLLDLVLHIYAMQAENERAEQKRRQAQGIAVAKKKGVYKGRAVLYSENSPNPQKRAIYERIVRMLTQEKISMVEIAKQNGVDRKTVRRIRDELNRNNDKN